MPTKNFTQFEVQLLVNPETFNNIVVLFLKFLQLLAMICFLARKLMELETQKCIRSVKISSGLLFAHYVF